MSIIPKEKKKGPLLSVQIKSKLLNPLDVQLAVPASCVQGYLE
jgi:hypothetical protein